jgi:hypothetical protein
VLQTIDAPLRCCAADHARADPARQSSVSTKFEPNCCHTAQA